MKYARISKESFALINILSSYIFLFLKEDMCKKKSVFKKRRKMERDKQWVPIPLPSSYGQKTKARAGR